jgi:hypothetical protein
LTLHCAPTVELLPLVGVAEQKLPNPWVGITLAAAGSSAASRRTEWYWAWVSFIVESGPTRSVRPVAPNSIDPPVNTTSTSPSPLCRV